MNNDLTAIRDKIIKSALPHVCEHGWSFDSVEQGAVDCGYNQDMVTAAFPDGMDQIVGWFSGWADREMMMRLKSENPEDYRIRDRVKLAVITRIEVLEPYKEAVKMSLSYWARPMRGLQGSKVVWDTADVIWVWAGDTSTDYNRYTKRGLLSGVLASTMLTFLSDDSEDLDKTRQFLERRIENVMTLGKFIGQVKGKFGGSA
jgi:ubiquinone biosynthesis protein COQ9